MFEKKIDQIDYSKYVLSKKEYIEWGFLFFILGAIIGELMFDNLFIGIIIITILSPVFYKRTKKFLCLRRKRKLETQFCLYLQLMASSLSAGNTIEQFFKEVIKNENEDEIEENSLIYNEFKQINLYIEYKHTAAEAFAYFAQRSGSSDIQSFSVALTCGLHSGGNLVDFVHNASNSMGLKLDTENEIIQLLSYPKFNHNILTIMPFVFLLVLKYSSPDYINVLYHGVGQIIMAIITFTLFIAWYLGEKLSEIKY